jgi:hypothetical protein
MEFLKFEYLKKTNQLKKADQLLQKLKENLSFWLLHNNNCLAVKLFFSLLEIPGDQKNDLPVVPESAEIIFDQSDFFSVVVMKLYHATSKLNDGTPKECATLLNEALGAGSLLEYPHMEIELKLTLAYAYALLDEYDLCQNLVRSVTRKIKSIPDHTYQNALEFCKLIGLIGGGSKSSTTSQKLNAALSAFTMYNQGNTRILMHLQPQLIDLKFKFPVGSDKN